MYAYRKGPYKLITGHTHLEGGCKGHDVRECENEDQCVWVDAKNDDVANAKALKCDNGWGRPLDTGSPEPPHLYPKRDDDQPDTVSMYAWGDTWLFNVETDPEERNDLSQDDKYLEIKDDLQKA